MNTGLGSGSVKRTNTGGPSASFGIWHDYAAEVKTVAARYGLTIGTLHTHIGSGTDPEVWKRATRMTLDLEVERAPIALAKGLDLAPHVRADVRQIHRRLLRHAPDLEAAPQVDAPDLG